MKRFCFTVAVLMMTAATCMAQKNVPRICNIINFIRQTEPRPRNITDEVLYQTVVNELDVMKQNNLRGTFLLQYDALINPKYQALMRSLPEGFEVGAWWEITQPHVEAAGMKWRGRYPWDWHANVGFATGYSLTEREKLVDVYMAKFKEIFGHYPASVGSWFIDAHTLNYMYEKYHIVASCNCRDQIGTDGYNLWGGYWEGAYYPSKRNAYMPAQTEQGQINVPVFRMLGTDPIQQYDVRIYGPTKAESTLEPVMSGSKPAWVDWFFRIMTSDPAMGYTYFQTGQENSFTWEKISKGFELQMPKIAKLQKEGKLRIETLEESGRAFSQRYKLTPATAHSAMSDYSNRNAKTLWFNSRFFRTNLLWEQGHLRIRDMHVFNEQKPSLYADSAGTSTECKFFTLPIVDGCRWSTPEDFAGMRLSTVDANNNYKELSGGTPEITTSEKSTMIKWLTTDGAIVYITLTEGNMSMQMKGEPIGSRFCLILHVAKTDNLPFTGISLDKLSAKYDGFPYSMTLTKGSFIDTSRTNTNNIFGIVSDKGKIVMNVR
jgi:hypothetical protein